MALSSAEFSSNQFQLLKKAVHTLLELSIAEHAIKKTEKAYGRNLTLFRAIERLREKFVSILINVTGQDIPVLWRQLKTPVELAASIMSGDIAKVRRSLRSRDITHDHQVMCFNESAVWSSRNLFCVYDTHCVVWRVPELTGEDIANSHAVGAKIQEKYRSDTRHR